jgi:outer membrane murein-binding lipoprotein Lpp
MYMDKKFFLIITAMVAITPVSGWTATPDNQAAQTTTLDQQIKQLKDERAKAKMQAYVAGSNADQWLGQSWVNYQQAIAKQEKAEQRVKELDAKIAELEKQKAASK